MREHAARISLPSPSNLRRRGLYLKKYISCEPASRLLEMERKHSIFSLGPVHPIFHLISGPRLETKDRVSLPHIENHLMGAQYKMCKTKEAPKMMNNEEEEEEPIQENMPFLSSSCSPTNGSVPLPHGSTSCLVSSARLVPLFEKTL